MAKIAAVSTEGVNDNERIARRTAVLRCGRNRRCQSLIAIVHHFNGTEKVLDQKLGAVVQNGPSVEPSKDLILNRGNDQHIDIGLSV